MDFYTLDQLAVTGVSLGSIRELSVHNEPGSHGVMEITAQVQQEDEETLLYGMASRQPGALWAGKTCSLPGCSPGWNSCAGTRFALVGSLFGRKTARWIYRRNPAPSRTPP